MTAAKDTPLFAEFEKVSRDAWVAAIEKSLRGRSLDSLIKRTYEGIDQSPIATVDDLDGISDCGNLPGQYPFLRGTRAAGYLARPWLIAQELDLPDPQAFNRALHDALAKGQTAIVLGANPRIETVADLQTALAGIDLGQVPLFLADDARALNTYKLLCAGVGAETLAHLRGCIGYDPLHKLAQEGFVPNDTFERMVEHAREVNERSPQLGCIAVRTDAYHDAGANAIQELAIAVSTGAVYLREMTTRGLAVNQVAGRIHFFLSIGENFFMEIAKLRAMRMIWSQVVRAFGGDVEMQKIHLHARCASRNKTQLDPHSNILRATSEALAAAIAGVNSITVPPFDSPLGESDLFSRRIARNLQLILQDELRLTKLIDPAGGSWHIEKLTDQLAQAAWKMFQDIEATGGLLAALKEGQIQAGIDAVAQQRRRDLAQRKTVLVGSNMYPNLDDRPAIRKLPPEPQDSPNQDGYLTVKALSPLRLAADYVELRRRAEEYRRVHGAAPTVLVLGIGPESVARAKMNFVFSVYELGGFECIGGAGNHSVESALVAALSSRARACVVCGNVDETEDLGSLVKELRAGKPEMVIVVATDLDIQDNLRELGADDVVNQGADFIALNQNLQMRLGVGK